jgi:hypothetical protein
MIFFFIYLILPAAVGSVFYSASITNEYQEQKNVSGGRVRPENKAYNVTSIFEPII